MKHRKYFVDELERLSSEEYSSSDKIPVVIVLDNVRSMHNIGSAFRTSDAFRIESIHLCGITAIPPSAEIHKTALGAEDVVDWVYYEKTIDSIISLKNDGYTVLAIEQAENTIMLNEFVPEKGSKYAFIFGNEVKGVSQDAINICNNCIEIPQYGTKHSLNISICVGIILWDITNKIRHL